MEILMIFHTKNNLVKKLISFRASQHLLKKIGHILLINLALSIQVFAADDLKDEERQAARSVIKGVVTMYSTYIQFPDINYTLTGGRVYSLNASYSRDNKTFNFPHVFDNNNVLRIRTALDQGIVAHEAGHMVLFYLAPQLILDAHTGAFHEAFGDLTAHFFRFWNPYTHQIFLNDLAIGDGCVGDNSNTCVRNSHISLTLKEVLKNENLCEVHALSETFSSAVYNNMMIAYIDSERNERAMSDIVFWHIQMLANTGLAINTLQKPTLMDIAFTMLKVSEQNPIYRDTLGHNFLSNNLITLIQKPLGLFYEANQEFQAICQIHQQSAVAQGYQYIQRRTVTQRSQNNQQRSVAQGYQYNQRNRVTQRPQSTSSSSCIIL